MDDCRELDDGVATEDGVVRVGKVYDIEGYELRPLGVTFTNGHVQFNFPEGLNFLPSEADEGILGLVLV